MIAYDKKDTSFVYQEFLPVLKTYSESPIGQNLITISTNKDKYKNKMKRRNRDPSFIVIFSQNYLQAQFGNVSINNILSIMKETEKALFVFADIGPDDSIYTFLKEQRDIRNSVVWNEPHLWQKLSKLVDMQRIGQLIEGFKNMRIASQLTDTHPILPDKDAVFLDYFATGVFSGHFFYNGDNSVCNQTGKDWFRNHL